MADISHGSHSHVGDLHFDDLASIQIALSFIGVELEETVRVDVEEEDPADNVAGSWQNVRIP
jgi:hypothetical protein